MNWFDARHHCEAEGARLPTEAEWEYAARGPDSLVYTWGNSYNAALVIGDGDPTYSGRRTAPVGSRPGSDSWVGTLDLSGNLWEWTSLPYDTYDDDHESNTAPERWLRGGSFHETSDDVRTVSHQSRLSVRPSLFRDNGFRCVHLRC